MDVNKTQESRVSTFFSILGKEFLDFRESRLATPPPPLLRAPAGDPTPITPVKCMFSGEIESLDEDPGIATLDLGMRFPGN